MENFLKNLQKENKEREKRLNIVDRKVVSNMVGYMKAKKICEYDVERVKKDVIREMLRSYGKRKKSNAINEDNYQEYCDDVCKHMRQASSKELSVNRLKTAILAVGLMFIVRLIDVVIAGGDFFHTPVEVSLGYLSAVAAILIGTLLMYIAFSKILTNKSMKMSVTQTIVVAVILIAIVGCAYAGVYFLSDVHLFNVIWWIPLLVICVLYALCDMTYIKIQNQIAKES